MVRTSGKHDPNETLKRIGADIRARRIELGLSQEALADAAGVDRSHMGKIERGERNVTILLLARIVRAVDSSIAAVAAGSKV